ncbi:MAG: hypothetical protein WDW38_002821 [Sanguina aurantia]
MVEALQVLSVVSLMPHTRRHVVGTLLHSRRPGMAVLLTAATLSNSSFFPSDPQVVTLALRIINNCVTVPPSLAELLPHAPSTSSSSSSSTPMHPASFLSPSLCGASPLLSPIPMWSSHSASAGAGAAGGREGDSPDAATAAAAAAGDSGGLSAAHTLPALDLGPSNPLATAVSRRPALSALAAHLEAAYSYCRACLRANNGIRVLMLLLQKGNSGSVSLQPAMLDQIRAMACQALVGMAQDPGMRHILSQLQIGRLLADLVHDPSSSISSRGALAAAPPRHAYLHQTSAYPTAIRAPPNPRTTLSSVPTPPAATIPASTHRPAHTTHTASLATNPPPVFPTTSLPTAAQTPNPQPPHHTTTTAFPNAPPLASAPALSMSAAPATAAAAAVSATAAAGAAAAAAAPAAATAPPAVAAVPSRAAVLQRRPSVHLTHGGPVPQSGAYWLDTFQATAIELITLTNAGVGGAGGSLLRPDKLSAAAATDATAPTLQKMQRAAIAAATPLTYSSQELLLLIWQHLRSAGLHSSAAALHKEAHLSSAASSSQAHAHPSPHTTHSAAHTTPGGWNGVDGSHPHPTPSSGVPPPPPPASPALGADGVAAPLHAAPPAAQASITVPGATPAKASPLSSAGRVLPSRSASAGGGAGCNQQHTGGVSRAQDSAAAAAGALVLRGLVSLPSSAGKAGRATTLGAARGSSGVLPAQVLRRRSTLAISPSLLLSEAAARASSSGAAAPDSMSELGLDTPRAGAAHPAGQPGGERAPVLPHPDSRQRPTASTMRAPSTPSTPVTADGSRPVDATPQRRVRTAGDGAATGKSGAARKARASGSGSGVAPAAVEGVQSPFLAGAALDCKQDADASGLGGAAGETLLERGTAQQQRQQQRLKRRASAPIPGLLPAPPGLRHHVTWATPHKQDMREAGKDKTPPGTPLSPQPTQGTYAPTATGTPPDGLTPVSFAQPLRTMPQTASPATPTLLPQPQQQQQLQLLPPVRSSSPPATTASGDTPRAGSGGGVGAAAPLSRSSDADTIARLVQQHQPALGLGSAAHGSSLPSTPAPGSTHNFTSSTPHSSTPVPVTPTPGTAAGSAVPPSFQRAGNPLLADLPSNRTIQTPSSKRGGGGGGGGGGSLGLGPTPLAGSGGGAGASGSGSSAPPHKVASSQQQQPQQLPLHVQAASADIIAGLGRPVQSTLAGIIDKYLRFQHRAACMTSPCPVTTVPTLSLAFPHVLPVASRAMEAPVNAAARGMRKEVTSQYGGRGGARADRQLIYSRFRPLRTFRDDSLAVLCVTFMGGQDTLVCGCDSGELRVQHVDGFDTVEVVAGHSGAVGMVRSFEDGTTSLLLSSSKSEVKLWDGSNMGEGPSHQWEGVGKGRFNSAGSQVVAVTSSIPRKALIYDVATGATLMTLTSEAAQPSSHQPEPLPPGHPARAQAGPQPATMPGFPLARGIAGLPTAGLPAPGGVGRERASNRAAAAAAHSACWNGTDELLLWGSVLWDPRARAPIHTFDLFSECGAGCFHPARAEVILNSEVWDLRSMRLLRSLPQLDGTQLVFNAGADVMYAVLRRPADDLSSALAPRRARHPLRLCLPNPGRHILHGDRNSPSGPHRPGSCG